MEYRPWSEWRNGQAMTKRQLAEALDAFSIVPNNIRLSSGRIVKGYYKDAFAKVAAHYPLPPNAAETPSRNANPPRPKKTNGFRAKRSATGDAVVADRDAEKSQKHKGCSGIAAQKAPSAENGGVLARERERGVLLADLSEIEAEQKWRADAGEPADPMLAKR
jgi:hypothetical protein